MITGASLAIKKATAGPIQGTQIAKSLTKAINTTQTNQSTDSTKTSDDTTEIGKEKDGEKTETQTPKSDAERKAEQDAAIMAAIGGHRIPGFPATKEETEALQKKLETNPAQFPGIDVNPTAKPSSASSDSSPSMNNPFSIPNSGGGNNNNGWVSAGAHHPGYGGGGYGSGGSGGYGGGGNTPGTRPGPISNPPQGHHYPSLAELNARADRMAADNGSRLERIFDPKGGLQEVIVHNVNDKTREALAQLAPMYRELTGRSPTGREFKHDGDHTDMVIKFGNKAQLTTQVAATDDSHKEATEKAAVIEKQKAPKIEEGIPKTQEEKEPIV